MGDFVVFLMYSFLLFAQKNMLRYSFFCYLAFHRVRQVAIKFRQETIQCFRK